MAFYYIRSEYNILAMKTKDIYIRSLKNTLQIQTPLSVTNIIKAKNTGKYTKSELFL